MRDSKVILRDVFYENPVNFLYTYLLHTLHPWRVSCYVHTSIQYLFTRQMFSVRAVQRYNLSRANTFNAILCVV